MTILQKCLDQPNGANFYRADQLVKLRPFGHLFAKCFGELEHLFGKAPDQLISINNVLLTHGHMDHSAGIAYYLSHRIFCGQKPGRVFAPENMILPMREIIDGWGRLDGNKIPAELVGMQAGDEHQIKPNLFKDF